MAGGISKQRWGSQVLVASWQWENHNGFLLGSKQYFVLTCYLSCVEPGVGVSDPCGILPTQDILFFSLLFVRVINQSFSLFFAEQIRLKNIRNVYGRCLWYRLRLLKPQQNIIPTVK